MPLHDVTVEMIPPKEDSKRYYSDRYRCCPPPLFLPVMTLAEIGCYVYYVVQMDGSITTSGPIPVDCPFIYRPDRRAQIWRFVSYTCVHAGWVHLFFNTLVQILVGTPLEMVHGSMRIACIYFAGVLSGSLGASVFDMNAYLLGASGGVYALLAAHVSNILLNYQEMELRFLKIGAIVIIAGADIGFAIHDRYVNSAVGTIPPVAYVAHLTGAFAGLTLGLVVLKNFEEKLHKQILWWIGLSFYLSCTFFAVLWNLFCY